MPISLFSSGLRDKTLYCRGPTDLIFNSVCFVEKPPSHRLDLPSSTPAPLGDYDLVRRRKTILEHTEAAFLFRCSPAFTSGRQVCQTVFVSRKAERVLVYCTFRYFKDRDRRGGDRVVEDFMAHQEKLGMGNWDKKVHVCWKLTNASPILVFRFPTFAHPLAPLRPSSACLCFVWPRFFSGP